MTGLTWRVMLGWKGSPSCVSAVAGGSTQCAQLTVRDGCASLVFYMVFILSFFFFARWRPESTASTKWPISFFAAHPSICSLCVWFFQVLCFFMHSLLFSIQYACLFLCHVCQINNNLSQSGFGSWSYCQCLLKNLQKILQMRFRSIPGIFLHNLIWSASFQRINMAFGCVLHYS